MFCRDVLKRGVCIDPLSHCCGRHSSADPVAEIGWRYLALSSKSRFHSWPSRVKSFNDVGLFSFGSG